MTSSTYDALNRAITTGSSTDGSPSRLNVYNADGVLVQQGSTRYVQDLASPLSQILGDGTNTYVYGQERLFAQQGSTKTWYATDALGSVRQTLNDSGTVLGNVAYDPWGQVQRGTVPTFGFTGELQQGSNVYLRARWYTTQRGTFTSRDSFAGWPEQPYSLHPYAYVYSNPALFTDPSGKCLGWLWGDPSCQFAGTDYTKYDYVGAGQVFVTGLGGLATAVACIGTAGFACAAGAAGAAAVTSWGNQALSNAGKPVTQAAISNVNWGTVTVDAAVAAATVPIGSLVAKGLGKFGSAIANAVRAYSDLHLSRIRILPPPESGITELMDQAISRALSPGQVLAVRGRGVGAYLYDFEVPGRPWTLPCKPQGAKTLGEKLPNGVRFVITKEGDLDLVVSDLDTAWLVQNGMRLKDELAELRITRGINNLYQAEIVQHGSHVTGVEKGVAPIGNLDDTVYLFSPRGYIGSGLMLDKLEQFAPTELPTIEKLRVLLRSVQK